MTIAFCILAALLIRFSYRSYRGGGAYLEYFRSELAKPESSYTPFATVIVPCRGLDDGLEENLSKILDQNYPVFEVIFVVDDENDPAADVIRKVSRRVAGDAEKAKMVVAPKADGSSQKVENLRVAVLHAAPGSEIFVFADSDARPSRNWLRSLVAPLSDPKIGAATGYRWFVRRPSAFASEICSAWNASIASALGPNRKSNFCWGGSTAIRRDLFESLDVRDRWAGTLSDDFTLTKAVGEEGLAIHFVPQALCASSGCSSVREMLEFTTRQMKITRVYAPHLWKISFFGSALFNLVMIAALIIVATGRPNELAFWAAAVTVALVSLFSTAKAWLRLRAVKMVLKDEEGVTPLHSLAQCTLWLAAPALFLWNCFAAFVSRRIEWRGTVYELVSATETRVIERG